MEKLIKRLCLAIFDPDYDALIFNAKERKWWRRGRDATLAALVVMIGDGAIVIPKDDKDERSDHPHQW